MEKSKKISFNRKLYLDGLRQLRMIGIMGAVIMAIAAFGIPIFYNIENSQYIGTGMAQAGIVRSYNILRMNPFIVLVFAVIVPVMMLYLFSFLNRRNACDFYHSIPDTRNTVALSYGASILTWSMGIAVESLVISFLSAAVLKYVEISVGRVLVLFCAITAAVIFVMGVFLIAMSVTGTLFNNIVVAGMIMAVPRIFVTYAVYCITDAINVMTFSFGDSIFDDRLNVVTNLITGYMIRGDYQAWYLWESVIYTFIVGVLYCIIGIRLFNKRKSETATCSAVSPRLQGILRLIPACTISLVPLYYFYQLVAVKGYIRSLNSEDIFVVVLMYVIAVVSVYLYEIITTGKLKNFKRATKSIAGLVIFNVITFVLLVIGFNIMLNDVPDVSSVEAVRFNKLCGNYYSYDDEDYFGSELSDISITSEEMKEVIVSELQRCVDAQKTGRYYEMVAESDEYSNNSDYKINSVMVELDCGLISKSRVIRLSEASATRVIELLAQEEKVRDLIYTVAEQDEIDITPWYGISDDDMYKIYVSYMEELKKMPFEKALNFVLENIPWEDYFEDIQVKYSNGKSSRMVLTPDFKETVSLFYKLVNQVNDQQPLETFLKDYEYSKANENTVYSDSTVFFELYNCGAGYVDSKRYSFSANYYCYGGMETDFTQNGEKLLYEINDELTAQKDKPIDTTKMFVKVEMYKYNDHSEMRDWLCNYYPVNGELYEMLMKFSR